MSEKCDNCGAVVEQCGRDFRGRKICCPDCMFNPRGCRCRFGEFGVAETYVDPDFPGEFDPKLDDFPEYDE